MLRGKQGGGEEEKSFNYLEENFREREREKERKREREREIKRKRERRRRRKIRRNRGKTSRCETIRDKGRQAQADRQAKRGT